MDPMLIDVNVHPTKREVRLSKERELCQLIKETVQLTLREQRLIPNVQAKPSQQPKSNQVAMDLSHQSNVSSPQKVEWNYPIPRETIRQRVTGHQSR